jgi:hypothetical protein
VKKERRYIGFFLLSLTLVIAGVFSTAQAQPNKRDGKPTVKKLTISRKGLDQSIVKGLRSLAGKTTRKGELNSRSYRYQDGGAEALVALAALEAGGDPDAPGLKSLLKRLSEQTPARTTTRAFRAMVYARLGETRREALEKDVQWLLQHQRDDGGWGETSDAPANTFDSALAMLALQQADRLGAKTPTSAWDRAKQFLLVAQNSDGGYGYQYVPGNKPRLRGSSNGPATAAAAVMWGVLIDRKQLPANANGKDHLWTCFNRTASWLEQNFNIKTVPQWHWGDAPEQTYRHLLLLASPSLRTSRPEWSALPGQLASFLMDQQTAEGFWRSQPLAEDDTVATAWAVLTLTRARQELQAAQPAPTKVAPVFTPRLLLVVGRIHHAGDWNIMEHTEQQWSNALAGAVSVGLKRRDVFAGQDYDPNVALVHLTGTQLAGFGAPARDALKAYLQRGGLVLIDPAMGGNEFFEQAETMLEQIYGMGSVVMLPPDSPIITGRFAGGVGTDVSNAKFTPAAARQAGREQGPPVLWAVKDKGRIVAILSRYSLAVPTADESSALLSGYHPADAKRLAANILLYTYAARQQALGTGQ